MLRRAVELTLSCAGAEVVLLAGTAESQRRRAAACDAVVVLGAAHFFSGSLSAESLRPRGSRRPEIYVISWQHSEHAVLSLLECGVDQYMTLPLSLGRLRLKLAAG